VTLGTSTPSEKGYSELFALLGIPEAFGKTGRRRPFAMENVEEMLAAQIRVVKKRGEK